MTSSKLGKFCDSLIEAGWLLAAIVAPLFFNVYSSRNIEPDKIAVLRAIVAVMAAAWLIQWIDQRAAARSTATPILRAPFVAPTLALIAINFLATFTSLAPRTSFFGQHIRPEGMHTLLAYAVVFFMVARGLRTRRQLDRLITAIILTSLPVGAYGILQKLQLDPMQWTGDMSARVGANLGNPIFLGAYLIMVFCLTLGLLIETGRAARRQPARIVALAGIALVQAVAIVLSGSRGPWVGWLAGLFIFALLIALATRRRRVIWSVIGLSAAGAIALGALNIPNTPLEPLRSLPTIGALGHLFEGESGTGQVRTLIWQGDAQLIFGRTPIHDPDGATDRFDALRPLVGYGPDAMYLAFSQVMPPELAALHGRETLSDRSHNETWDTLINTGFAGLIAYQWLFLSLFLCGLRWIGLLTTQRQRNGFIALWIGLGTAGGLAALLLNQVRYLGLAMPVGNVIGLLVYLAIFALTEGRSNQPTALRADQVLIIALLSGVMAHYIETQFGLAVAGTRITFWVFAAMLVALGSKPLTAGWQEPAPAAVRPSRATATSYGLIVAVILTTLAYEFITRNHGLTDPLAIVWRALTFDLAKSATSYAIVGLLVLTWGLSSLIVWSSLSNARRAWIAAVSLGLPIVFALGLAAQLAALITVPLPINQAYGDALVYGRQLTGLFDSYIIGLLGLMTLMAVALLVESNLTRAKRPTKMWSAIAVAPIAVIAAIWINTVNLDPIRADIFYKLGQEYVNYPEAAAVLHKQAVLLAPSEDFYYLELGDALRKKANRSDPEAASILNDQSQVTDFMNLDQARTIGLGRDDALYAALLMLWRARDLNPLYADHTLNLARFFVPDLPVNTDPRRALVERSNEYYAQALRLRPLNVLFWNEWAEFDLTYRDDPDSALTKLTESLRLDPKFNETHMALGKTYSARQDLDRAAAAYRQALDLRPDLPAARSKLAFVYHQQGNLAGALESFHAYIALAPDAPNVWEAHKNLALIYKQMGDLPKALSEAQIAAQLAPDEARSQLNEWVEQLRELASHATQ